MISGLNVMHNKYLITTERCLLRKLQPSDATPTYLSWFNEPEIKQYIEAKPRHMDDLKQFIIQCTNNPIVYLLGIFVENNDHIGNIKFEFLDHNKQNVDMGILIGNTDYRGKAIAPEVIRASGYYFRKKFNTQKIVLGVSKTHHHAIKSYKKMGFDIELEPLSAIDEKQGLLMSWLIQ